MKALYVFKSYLQKTSPLAFSERFHIFLADVAGRFVVHTHVVGYAESFPDAFVAILLAAFCRPADSEPHGIISVSYSLQTSLFG